MKKYKGLRRLATKLYLIQIKGGACEICGFNDIKFPECFDFHHKDSKTKDFNISHSILTDLNKVKEEIKKCLLLCVFCHRKLHFKHRDKIAILNQLGGAENYLKTIRKRSNLQSLDKICAECKISFRAINSRNKFCSLKCCLKKKSANIPSQEILEKVLKNNKYNFCATGRHFKVSNMAIKKWCIKYNIPLKV